MNLSEEQLSVVEEMAGLFYGPEDIALNLGLTPDETDLFLIARENQDTTLPIISAFFKGRLSSEILLRKAIKQAAQNGSSPAQQIMLNFYRESKI